jgi:hypothetical protein
MDLRAEAITLRKNSYTPTIEIIVASARLDSDSMGIVRLPYTRRLTPGPQSPFFVSLAQVPSILALRSLLCWRAAPAWFA